VGSPKRSIALRSARRTRKDRSQETPAFGRNPRFGQRPPQPEHDDRRGAEVAEQQAARALAGEHHEHDGERHRHRHVRARGINVGARALVDAQLGVDHLEVRERPQAEDRAVDQQRVGVTEQQPRDPVGEDDREERRYGRGPRHHGGRRARDPVAAGGVVVEEVEADERLAHARAQEDARQDHRRQQRFRGAV
jgi:hypothetical protein